jgi:hypothetical protein
MALTTKDKVNFINDVRGSATEILNGINGLIAELAMYQALDMGGSLTDDKLQDSDFVNDNAGLTAADISNIFGTTLPALKTLLNQGHATNLYRIKI